MSTGFDASKPAVVVSTGLSMYLSKEANLYTPDEIVAIANVVGFKKAKYISGDDLYQRYFIHRSDGLRAGNAEGYLIATTYS